MSQQTVDVVVVTALQLERRAVRAHLDGFEVESLSGMSADIGFSYANREQRIAVIETGPGNVAAGLLALRAEASFRPSYMFMLGVAGGIKDVEIGDVVISSKIYWIEGGKADTNFRARPDFAAVSGKLVQLARSVAADGAWIEGGRGGFGSWPDAGRGPEAMVAPIAVAEKVIADRGAEASQLIANNYSDAVAVDMEDFGALRGGAETERAMTIAIRGVSDLLTAKTDADKKGSQPLAAANAAAFLFKLLDRLAELPGSGGAISSMVPTETYTLVLAVGRELYPDGPQQAALWERAGGDRSLLQLDGSGATRWWSAIQTVKNGGGGFAINIQTIIRAMQEDYPGNARLLALVD
ncbi:phosphorylase family protein [Rhodococcoides fascians]|uniref:phosphorylase family protein n=1 Tax=Rhodococcoides fascians TaxID=1828 RepID=UPI00068C0A40|nr:effector-associated domain EAD1-containing protein [Rhodococcus fascians]